MPGPLRVPRERVSANKLVICWQWLRVEILMTHQSYTSLMPWEHCSYVQNRLALGKAQGPGVVGTARQNHVNCRPQEAAAAARGSIFAAMPSRADAHERCASSTRYGRPGGLLPAQPDIPSARTASLAPISRAMGLAI